MKNCGLHALRLVAPRDNWPNPRAWATASGAEKILEEAKFYSDTPAALAGLTCVYATTARQRDMIKDVYNARQAAEHLAKSPDAHKTGLMFGGERSGLDNHDVALADYLITIPLNAAFSSLNLAQAVLLVAYEYFQTQIERADPSALTNTVTATHRQAPKEELLHFFDRLHHMLEETGFYHITEKKSIMQRNLQNIFHRGQLTSREIQTLQGVITSLSRKNSDHGTS